jgi:hypothetical protein
VEVVDEDEAERVLACMRLDVARSKTTHYTMSLAWSRELVAGAVGVAVAWFIGLATCELGALVFAGSAFVALMLAFADHEIRVAIGADGIHVRRPISGARFLAFGAIREVTLDARNLHVRLHDGTSIRLNHYAGGKGAFAREQKARVADLVARIRAHLACHSTIPTVSQSALHRGGRATADWVRGVSSAVDACASFRSNAIPPDELWRVVEDTTSSAALRAGAAVALRGELDAEGRVRLRTIADACAGPKLRVALETVASGKSDDVVQQVLEPLTDEPNPTQRA